MSKTRKFNRISLHLAWESSRNFATPPKVSLWNDVRGRNKEISHWWGVNTQVLVGASSLFRFPQRKFASTNQKHHPDLGRESDWLKKKQRKSCLVSLNTCRLPLMPTFSVLVLLIMMMIMWWWWFLWCMLHGRYVRAGNFSQIIRSQQAASDLFF